VTGVFASSTHSFSKVPRRQITLLKGLGIEGDAHAGVLVQHLFDQRRDPTRPNLRQVHLMASELLDDLESKGFALQPGELGENISTRGLDLVALPRGTRLQIGPTAVIEITGLRSCCIQIENFRPGMLQHMLVKQDGKLVRKGGVMGVILEGGVVSVADTIQATLPAEPFEALEVV
jgi:MOSC domain-containing protein YiiM